MIEILNRCNYLYDNLIDCHDKNYNVNKDGDCLNCTRNNFRLLNNDLYDCLKKLCTYTMYYGPLYVDEIYNFLVQSNFIKSYIEQQRNIMKSNPLYGFNNLISNDKIPIYLNIMSLGCGFGPDDIALNKYREVYLDRNVNFNYLGYDKEPLWNYITQTNTFPITCDLLDGMNFKNVNILFINKLFSTLKNFNFHNDFLDVFKEALEELPVGAFVVFNDINSYKQGRDIFDNFTKYNFLQVIGKYYFYQQHFSDWIQLENTNNICVIPNNLKVTPKNSFTDLVFFLYQKV